MKSDVVTCRDTVDDHIGEQVVRSLGTPDDLLKVQVRRVGTDRYRVNVFVGKDFTSGRVANSYFLTADGEGKILTSSPTTRQGLLTGSPAGFHENAVRLRLAPPGHGAGFISVCALDLRTI